MNNTIRAFSKLPVRVHLSESIIEDKSVTIQEMPWLDVVVTKHEEIAVDTIAVELGECRWYTAS